MAASGKTLMRPVYQAAPDLAGRSRAARAALGLRRFG
jgi:hypothetical protein